MKAKKYPMRYWTVKPKTSYLLHRMYSATRVAGNKTQCGIRVRAGWKVAPANVFAMEFGSPVRRCPRCQ